MMMIRWSRVFPYETITYNITEWIQTEPQWNARTHAAILDLVIKVWTFFIPTKKS